MCDRKVHLNCGSTFVFVHSNFLGEAAYVQIDRNGDTKAKTNAKEKAQYVINKGKETSFGKRKREDQD